MCDFDEGALYRFMGWLSFGAKFPILLNSNHYLTDFIAQNCHNKVLHNVLQQAVAEICKSYCVIRARTFMKKILPSCVICNKINPICCSYPNTSNLPKLKVNVGVPIDCISADYFGLLSQPTFICSKLTKEAPEQGLKYFQS